MTAADSPPAPQELYSREGLARLDARFLAFLADAAPALAERLAAARAAPQALAPKDESALLLALAPHLEDFLARLFGIVAEAQALAARHHALRAAVVGEAQFRPAARAAQGQARGRLARAARAPAAVAVHASSSSRSR
ncbi:MAG: hypothetical protein RML56_07355 [Burkholderiales bacterium]|nr:hypothetical protein [Burkholderiales bacterium]